MCKGYKANKQDRYGMRHGKPQDKQTSEKARKQTGKRANKKKGKQVVSTTDKCRFGLDVHTFIVLKYGRHTSKQDLCGNM